MVPAKIKAPVSKTAPQRLLLTIQNQRLKCNQLQVELDSMRKELNEHYTKVDNELHKDFVEIMSNNINNTTQCMYLLYIYTHHNVSLLARAEKVIK